MKWAKPTAPIDGELNNWRRIPVKSSTLQSRILGTSGSVGYLEPLSSQPVDSSSGEQEEYIH